MEIPVLTSRRLVLRPLLPDDAEDIQLLFPNWDVVRLMTSNIPWPYPEGAALKFINHVALPAMAMGTGWFWSIRRQEDQRHLIGVINLSLSDNSNRGFWLAQQWQRQGLMTEASQSVTDFWFNVLGQPVLRVPKAKDNLASRRVSERNGMYVVATQENDYIGGRMLTEVWEITRAEWNARRAVDMG
ncbi:GNAT family N-acetyltransferase [Pseudomonas lundensis]|uniref:GNAT family N-acetyltransferase n=1 Tax=Serratia proteamaculans TaxID=28151 RepID=UPI0029825DC3|nr:GNAT family N-acetyltransferase [Serratia proteamaculans]MDW5498516.1 GNAT family N-acetyltransferase [Serratia proteamaculans]MDW5503576.1 GNAT family N-acetyltransferase [Pseudomonas lundensis]